MWREAVGNKLLNGGRRVLLSKRQLLREVVRLMWGTLNMETIQLSHSLFCLLRTLWFFSPTAEDWLYTCAVRCDLHSILGWWKNAELYCINMTALTFPLPLFCRVAGLRARWPAGDWGRWRQHGRYWMSPPRKPAQGSGPLQCQTGVAGDIQRYWAASFH